MKILLLICFQICMYPLPSWFFFFIILPCVKQMPPVHGVIAVQTRIWGKMTGFVSVSVLPHLHPPTPCVACLELVFHTDHQSFTAHLATPLEILVPHQSSVGTRGIQKAGVSTNLAELLAPDNSSNHLSYAYVTFRFFCLSIWLSFEYVAYTVPVPISRIRCTYLLVPAFSWWKSGTDTLATNEVSVPSLHRVPHYFLLIYFCYRIVVQIPWFISNFSNPFISQTWLGLHSFSLSCRCISFLEASVSWV